MRVRGAIRQLDFKLSAGSVIPNINSLDYDEEVETGFIFKEVNLPNPEIPYLVPGLQVTPASVGRYRAKCTVSGVLKVFIPDLQITAAVSRESSFQVGGEDNFFQNDELLVLLTWDEIIQSQREMRMPVVEACGTLAARGYPYLTDDLKQRLQKNCHRDNNAKIHKPLEKNEEASTCEDCCGTRGRRRGKSFNGVLPRSSLGVEYTDGGKGQWNYPTNYFATPNYSQLKMPMSFRQNFYDPMIQTPNSHLMRFPWRY